MLLSISTEVQQRLDPLATARLIAFAENCKNWCFSNEIVFLSACRFGSKRAGESDGRRLETRTRGGEGKKDSKHCHVTSSLGVAQPQCVTGKDSITMGATRNSKFNIQELPNSVCVFNSKVSFKKCLRGLHSAHSQVWPGGPLPLAPLVGGRGGPTGAAGTVW